MLRLRKNPDWATSIGQWEIEEPKQDKQRVAELTIHLTDLTANHPVYGTAMGHAAELETYPYERAFLELVERISIVAALHSDEEIYPLLDRTGQDTQRRISHEVAFPTSQSEDYRFAKSNGVALHKTWEEACHRAAIELVGRHLILSSWVGQTRPLVTMEGAGRSQLNGLRSLYEIKRVHFGSQSITAFKTPIIASAIALLPREKFAPLIVGFGAAELSKDSLEMAEAEALQKLGLLWGKESPKLPLDFTPTREYHQEYHLLPEQREKIEAWFSGAFFKSSGAESVDITARRALNVQFLDISQFRNRGYYVAKAHCPETIPLVYGKWREREFASLPDGLLIHPLT